MNASPPNRYCILCWQNITTTRTVEAIPLNAPIHKGSLQLPEITSKSFTIIIPVYNALKHIQHCIESVLNNLEDHHVSVIIINDASGFQTRHWLNKEVVKHPVVQLIHNETNLGYTRSINKGIAATNADYVILLNSDTIVTPGWLSDLAKAAESKAEIGIVGPLSNAASWQSVPVLFDTNHKFAINQLPSDTSLEEFSQLVKKHSPKKYPEAKFINGFCFFIKREVIDNVGMFDEKSFPRGYGEENDYCVRAQKAGYSLAIVDNCYVFHAKSKSFGHEQRSELSKHGDTNLRLKHGNDYIKNLIHEQKHDTSLDSLRLSLLSEPSIKSSVPLLGPTNFSILFILPVAGGGGGSHSIVQETIALRRLGVQCNVAIQNQNLERFHSLYSDIPEHKDIFIGFSPQSIMAIAGTFDIVVGTVFHSLSIVRKIVQQHPHILPAYYIQDYEPLFFEEGTDEWQRAHDSYALIPQATLFAKTHWIAEQVQKNHALAMNKVQPSIDHEVYYPVRQTTCKRLVLSAMIRPKTPYRGSVRTMKLLEHLQEQFDHLEIHTFGCYKDDELYLELPRGFEHEHHGILKRPQVADLLRKTDIFIDLSDYQAFGRTALEAMACGATAIVPQKGGTDEYAEDDINALIVDTRDEAACQERIINLIKNPAKIMAMKMHGLATAARFSPHAAAISEITLFHSALQKHRIHYPLQKKPTVFVLPVFRKDGLPVGSAFVRLLQPLQHKNLLDDWNIRFATKSGLPSPDTADIIVIQRDAAGYDFKKIQQWALLWKQHGKKIIFEIDDNLLDQQGLKLRSDADAQNLARSTRLITTLADQVIVSTHHLKKVLKPFNPNIHVIENKLDDELWKIKTEQRSHDHLVNQQTDDIIRIGYIGTPSHDEDLQLITAAINKIQKKYGQRVTVEVIGGFQKNLKKPLFGESIGLPIHNDYPRFVEWLHKKVNWDIAVIPLVDDQFNASKSHLKFLECTALGMSCICSDVPSYNKLVRHGKNGLLCKNTTRSWYKAIEKLIKNYNLRKSLAEVAYQELRKNYTTASNADTYNDIFNLTFRTTSRAIPGLNIKKTPIKYRVLPYLSPEYQKELTRKQRLIRKLYLDPHQYFSDSKNTALRPFRLIFRKKMV